MMVGLIQLYLVCRDSGKHIEEDWPYPITHRVYLRGPDGITVESSQKDVEL